MEASELTRPLVEISSHDDETEAGDYIERWLRDRTGGTVTRDRHGNVIARRGSGPQLALVGHHDVVPPADSQIDNTGNYRIEQRDGRLYGRGTADMKGAVAAAMCAFRDATVHNGELLFVSFVGEEAGGRGARGAIEDGFAPDYAIVGEGSTGYSAPGVTDVAVAHKGRRASTIHASGERAHASEPEAGENAIYRASEAIEVVRGLSIPETEVFGRTLSGSLAVTEIEGGTAWNVIPDSCTITVDERTVPGERVKLTPLTERPGITVETEQDLPPMACDNREFVDLVEGAAAAAQSETPAQVSKPHATDAGWLADAGTSCVVCGAAEPGEAHTADESVSLAVVDRCHEIYRQAAEQFGESPLSR
jgi:acetylornithine deacetylase